MERNYVIVTLCIVPLPIMSGLACFGKYIHFVSGVDISPSRGDASARRLLDFADPAHSTAAPLHSAVETRARGPCGLRWNSSSSRRTLELRSSWLQLSTAEAVSVAGAG